MASGVNELAEGIMFCCAVYFVLDGGPKYMENAASPCEALVKRMVYVSSNLGHPPEFGVTRQGFNFVVNKLSNDVQEYIRPVPASLSCGALYWYERVDHKRIDDLLYDITTHKQ
jgi:hypothetical protein